MAERMGWRGQPSALWPAARSVIMLAEVYTPEEDPLAVLARRERGAVSVYARGRRWWTSPSFRAEATQRRR